MNKLSYVVGLMLLCTGCLTAGEEGADGVRWAQGGETLVSTNTCTARTADYSDTSCAYPTIKDPQCADSCAGDSSCVAKCPCVTSSADDSPTSEWGGGEVPSDWALGTFELNAAGIIGPETATIIGPEIRVLASMVARARTVTLAILNKDGKVLAEKKVLRDAKTTYMTDVETIRAFVKQKGLFSPYSVRLTFGY
jgi:hypothetical protein